MPPSPLRGEGILTPNPPAQNRRPVINVICNSTHVTIPDINITWESNPTHGPARCQYYVPICSGTGSVTPAFCAAKKSIFHFQSRSRRNPHFSPAAPFGITWTARPGGRALQRGSKASGAAGASPRPTENYPSKSGRPHGAAPTVETDHPYNRERSPHPSGLTASHLSLIGGRLIAAPTEGWLLMRAGEDTRPYADAGTVLFSSQGPVRDRPARIRTGSVGSAEPGAEIEPHQRQFLHPQGPVAR